MNDLELRNRLLNLAIVSAETEGMIEIERAHSAELLVIRPTIHITIQMPYGQGKTTLGKRIENFIHDTRSVKHPCRQLSSATWASIVGSIDESGKVTPPLSYYCKCGTIVIDEFQTAKDQQQSSVEATLTILEDEFTSRQQARLANNKQKFEDASFLGGKIEFRNLRSNWIFLTARNLQLNRELSMRMLIDRTVPILMSLDRDDLRKMDDEPNLMFEGLWYEPVSGVKIKSADYLKIREFVDTYMDKYEYTGNYFRAIGDCMRVYAIEREFDDEMFEFILRNKLRFAQEIENEA